MDFVSDPGLGDYFNVSNSSYQGTMDAALPQLDHVRSDFDVRHRIAVNTVYEISTPTGTTSPKSRSAAGKPTPSSASSPAAHCRSGALTPSPAISMATATATTAPTRRPLAITNPASVAPTIWTESSRFPTSLIPTPAAFVPATSLSPLPIGKNGNLGRNTFQGPGFARVDASLFKSIPLPNEVSLQFRAEAFNLFNRVNLYLPNDLLNVPTTFGKSTTAFAPRTMQLALKLVF
jgi:hypothetical protein